MRILALILLVAARVDRRDLLAYARGLCPLMLVFVQLLQVDEGVAVQSIELDDFLKGLERTIDEAAMPEVQSKTQQHIGVLERAQVGPLE